MSDKREELLTKSITSLMFKLCTPAIIGMVVIGLYSFMDGVFAGQLIGENAMAAISVSFPITLFNNGIATLVGVGSASVLSRAIGKNDQKTIDKIMGNLVANILLFSTIVMVIGLIFTKQLLQVTGAQGEILEFAVRYLRIVFWGSIFVNFTQSANMVMRGEGLMKKAMTIMGIGAALNIILDPILIKVMGERGIEGAAIATVISQIIQAIITLYYYMKQSKVVKIHKIQFAKELQKEMAAVGISAMMMQVLTIVQQTLMYRMSSKYGGDAQVILMGATLRIQMFAFIPLWGMSQGLQPVVGTNYGAKKYDRVKKATNIFIIGSTVLASLFWIPIEIIPHKILGLFIKDNEIVMLGITNFRALFSVFFLSGVIIMLITFFQAIGNGKAAGNMVLFRQIILFVPAILLLARVFGLPAVWFTQPIVDVIIVLFGIMSAVKEYKKMDSLTQGYYETV